MRIMATVSNGTALTEMDGYGDHLPVVVVMKDGTHREVEEIATATASDGSPCVGLILGEIFEP